jgi:ribosomal protein L12E/L44/L45/RPP1/RPP2
MQEEELIRHVYATTSTSYQPSMPNSMASQQDEGWSDEDEEDDDGWDTEDDEEEDDEEEDGDDEYGSVEP